MSIEHQPAQAGDGGNSSSARPAAKSCGDCTLCCTVLAVRDLNKPAGRACDHIAKGGGCNIYADRPGSCRAFQCFWTISDVLDEAWKPSRSGLMLWSNIEGRLIVEVDPERPGAWREEPYLSQLQAWADRSKPLHLEVLIRIDGFLMVLFPEGALDLGPSQDDLAVDSGYLLKDGVSVPYARYVEPASTTP